jgi:hypothetical protein
MLDATAPDQRNGQGAGDGGCRLPRKLIAEATLIVEEWTAEGFFGK